MMEGVCGHTYGHRSVWCFHDGKEGGFPAWWESLRRPGAEQMCHAFSLRLSRPYFSFRPAPELVEDRSNGMSHQCAGKGDGYAFLYSPLGLPLYTHLNSLGGAALRAAWFDPRTGRSQEFACVPPKDNVFVPPTSGKGQDWVLVLDVLK